MEGNIGLFGQFKYVFKGIIKPRFFNRLANQSVFCVVAYTIIAVILSAAAYWGITYLRCIGNNGFINDSVAAIKELPDFSYSSGDLVFAESTYIQTGETQYMVFNSDVDTADKAYIDKVEILTDWSNGVSVLVFNKKSITSINVVGATSSLKYSDIANILGLPNTFDKNGFINIFKEKFIIVYLIIAAISLVWFGIKAVALGFFFGLIGFGIIKIIKQPYNYKELVRISLYITGFTNILRNSINASPVKPPWMLLNIAFILIVGIYLFFALAGATEETGPSSTIVFSKPSSRKFEDVPAPDPFAKRDYETARTAPAAPTVSFTRKTESESTSTAGSSSEQSYSPASGAASGSLFSASTPFTRKSTSAAEESSSYAQSTTAYASQDAQTSSYSAPVTPSYAEPETTSYQTSSYSEPEAPSYSYQEPEPAPAPASAVVKSDIGTFGGLGGLSSGSGEKKSKSKWDRPITAPDAYNGLYYSGSDSEESYESNYGSGTLIDRGSSYGKTLGAPESSSNPFASVLGTPTASSTSYSSSTFSNSSAPSGLGGSLYVNHHDNASTQPTEHVAFTTKDGSSPFGNGGFYLSAPPKKGSQPSAPSTVKKGGKTVNRYSDDDFAAWERETYAEEFSKPRGGFGNNI